MLIFTQKTVPLFVFSSFDIHTLERVGDIHPRLAIDSVVEPADMEGDNEHQLLENDSIFTLRSSESCFSVLKAYSDAPIRYRFR